MDIRVYGHNGRLYLWGEDLGPTGRSAASTGTTPSREGARGRAADRFRRDGRRECCVPSYLTRRRGSDQRCDK
ncbi:hypothetical protein Acor_75400 [Acrocarpospora corrugata]|uniref:Uncharacterized protein n=1 Tax=Acrocarpospora corrugata TaxID=35763 RepID=A0A5M3WBQ5_9ACTN|nr:hypothetical protein Acor_75400 [Acrocarpospora corrugata]